MDYHRKSYDSLAHAAEKIFNRSQTPEVDPEPVIELEKETFEDLSEAVVRPNDVLVKKQQDKFNPDKERPTLMFMGKDIIRALKKMASPAAKIALDGAYMDGAEIVHLRTSKTIATMKVNMKLSDFAKDVEKWAKANVKVKQKAAAGDIKRDSDTRAIITIDDEMATQLKKSIHNAKAKIKVRIMKRKDGAKVYIDTDDKASLDSALEKAAEMMQAG